MTTTDTGASAKRTARSLERFISGLILGWAVLGGIYFVALFDSLNPSLLVLWGVVFAALVVVRIALHERGRP